MSMNSLCPRFVQHIKESHGHATSTTISMLAPNRDAQSGNTPSPAFASTRLGRLLAFGRAMGKFTLIYTVFVFRL